MDRPYIVCHMAASVDGRIDCDMTEKIIEGKDYDDALARLDCPSFLEGRASMEKHHAAKEPFSSGNADPVGKTCFHAACAAKGYAVAVDSMGKLRWPDNAIDGYPLLCLTSEAAPAAYLETLRNQGVSFIATGKNRLDLASAMTILHREFGVKRLAVVGGGHINAGFLQAGLIDEISLQIGPGIDGRANMAAVFDGLAADCEPVLLTLTSVETFASGTVWLRYKIK